MEFLGYNIEERRDTIKACLCPIKYLLGGKSLIEKINQGYNKIKTEEQEIEELKKRRDEEITKVLEIVNKKMFKLPDIIY